VETSFVRLEAWLNGLSRFAISRIALIPYMLKCTTQLQVLDLKLDYDGLNELFDKGAYHKYQRVGLRGIRAWFTRPSIAYVPLVIALLYAVSGDYISLLRHLRMAF